MQGDVAEEVKVSKAAARELMTLSLKTWAGSTDGFKKTQEATGSTDQRGLRSGSLWGKVCEPITPKHWDNGVHFTYTSQILRKLLSQANWSHAGKGVPNLSWHGDGSGATDNRTLSIEQKDEHRGTSPAAKFQKLNWRKGLKVSSFRI